jgi:gamma-glutamyltranspeptidase/glutathione hydrolase
MQNMPLQEAVCAPLVAGPHLGQTSDSLLEGRFSEATYQALRDLGHDVEWLPG